MQKENFRSRLIIENSAEQLFNFFQSTRELMKVIARACGYNDFRLFNRGDLTTFNHDMHRLTGIAYAGITE